MKIQYFNVFLCRNGEKTNYDLSKLIDIIRVSSPIERTVKLGSQHTMFMNNSRIPLHHVTNGSSLKGTNTFLEIEQFGLVNIVVKNHMREK